MDHGDIDKSGLPGDATPPADEFIKQEMHISTSCENAPYV